MSDAADGLNIAGIVGGITTVVTLLGSGVWRLLTRADRKAERLQEKEDALVAKLEKIVMDQGARIEALEADSRKLWMVIGYVVPALHAHDPKSPALKMASTILGSAFPIDLSTPPDMTDTLRKI